MNALCLLYHDVVDGDLDASGFPGARAARYKLGRASFEAHLDAIAEAADGPPHRVDTLLAAPAARRHSAPLLLTFDDGGISAHAPIADMLDARGWTGHFLITTGRIGAPGFLEPAHLRDLHARGHVLGSHSATHPAIISALAGDRLLAEWRDSVAALSDLLGQPVSTASVPGGYLSPAVAAAAAAADLRILFTSEPTVRIRTTPAGLRLVGRFTLRRHDPPRYVRALVQGRAAARTGQWLGWNLRKGIKRVGGRWYQAGQERWLRRTLRRA